MSGRGSTEPLVRIAAIVLVFTCLPAMAGDDPAGDTWEKKNYKWLETIASGQTVRVDNPFGNIYARFGGYENEVEVLATVQRLDPNEPELAVDVTRAEDGLNVTVRSGGSEPSSSTAGLPGKRSGRVDLVVFVPLEATLDARTDHDEIQAKGLRSDLVAHSVSGDIRIRSVSGHVRAESVRGNISAVLSEGVTDEPQEMITETGEIEVYLEENAGTTVKIATSGEISTDFSIQIEHLRFQEPGKQAVAVIGDGSSLLTLRSKRGRVRLLRTQTNFKADP